ncbi:MAG TPA: hypothetical protein VL381_09810 [Rhodocyclaceae bacterium]|nr:hypothetical protein [Rhodocyclaceae bacterium]
MKLQHFLLICACVFATSPVLAQGHGARMGGGERLQQRREAMATPSRANERINERAAERAERREQREQMSPEERRQLRRDVNDAGREIYRRPPSDRF